MAATDPKHAEDAGRRRRASKRVRLQSAIEKAAGYRESQDDAPEGEASRDEVRPMEEWRDLVSQRIDDAMRQGLFDNLSGQGKPLNLRRNPFLAADQQMAAALLHNNDLAPAWIMERKDVLAAIEALREELRRAAASMRREVQAAADEARRDQLQSLWTTWLREWQMRMEQVNRRILVQNLKQPVAHLEILMLRLPDELTRAGADPAWGRGSSDNRT